MDWVGRAYRKVRSFAHRALPHQVEYYLRYRAVAAAQGQVDADVQRRFQDMIRRSHDKPSLQIGARDRKYAPHWVSIDLYDTSPIIDFQYDVHDMPFAPETFEFVACNAVLEHVENPTKAIAELHRVLRPGGEIWVEVPMTQPYHPAPNDYWRVSHKGILIWMKAFTELSSGLVPIHGAPIYDYVYFHGRKPSTT
jgi:SAM-dependent methyltransferase